MCRPPGHVRQIVLIMATSAFILQTFLVNHKYVLLTNCSDSESALVAAPSRCHQLLSSIRTQNMFSMDFN